MLKTADYIYNNVLIADEANTTLRYVKKNQNGCDLSVHKIYAITEPGAILTSKTYVNNRQEIKTTSIDVSKCAFSKDVSDREIFKGWHLEPGTYIIDLNEGVRLGPNDTGLILHRSSLNRNGVTGLSAVFDAGFTTESASRVFSASMRITVNNPYGVYIEENARVAQILIFDSDDSGTLYSGQFQGGVFDSPASLTNREESK